MSEHGSSPLSPPDREGSAPPARAAGKFSIDNLVSAENTPTVASPSRSSPRKAATPDIPSGDVDVSSGVSDAGKPAKPAANGTRKPRSSKADAMSGQAKSGGAVNGSVEAATSGEGFEDSAAQAAAGDEAGVSNVQGHEAGGDDAASDQDQDEEDDENEGEEDEEEDDEDEDDDEDDDEEDDDDEDDASTGSRDLDEPTTGQEPQGDADVSMTDAQAPQGSETASGKTADGDNANKEVNVLTVKKQVKKRKQREPSMDVSLPKGPPSLPTVRIAIHCRAEDHGDYMNNVPEELYTDLKAKSHPWADWYADKKAAGDAQPASAAGGSSATGSASAAPALPEGLGDMGPFAHLLAKYPVEGPNGKQPKRKRRKRRENEEYDVNDPFVDDSELQIDEPTHSAKPASKGFYVVLGDVELEKLNKGKRGTKGSGGTMTPNGASGGGARGPGNGSSAPSYLISGTQLEVANRMIHLRAVERGYSEPSIPLDQLPEDAIGLADTSKPVGTRDSPIEIKDDASAAANNPKKKSYPTRPVDRRLAAELVNLQNCVKQESWENKARFPPSLRPPLRKAARIALELGEYSDNFFNYMPQIFPYNRFTMCKLIKREFFEDHVAMIKEKQDDLFEDLKQAVEEALPQHRADYEEALRRYKESGGTVPAATAPVSDAAEAGAGEDEEMADAGKEDGANASTGSANGNTAAAAPGGAHSAPVKKWKWTERMREDVFQIILVENGISELRIDKTKLEGSPDVISELVQRKGAYKRINDLWPENEGWTTTTGISKEFAIQKKKHDRHNNALAEQAAG